MLRRLLLLEVAVEGKTDTAFLPANLEVVPQLGRLPDPDLAGHQNPCLSLPALQVEVESLQKVVPTRRVKRPPRLRTLNCGSFRIELIEHRA
jgi:hypothetical protein